MDKGTGRNFRTEEELQKTRLLEEELGKTGELPPLRVREDLKIETVAPAVRPQKKRWKKRLLWSGVLLGFCASLGLGFYLCVQYNDYQKARFEERLKNQAQLDAAQRQLDAQRAQLLMEQNNLEAQRALLAQKRNERAQESTAPAPDDFFGNFFADVTGERQKKEQQKQADLAFLQQKINALGPQLAAVKEKIGEVNAAQQRLAVIKQRLERTYEENQGFLDTLKLQAEILFDKIKNK